MTTWTCHHQDCRRTFVHARYLVQHLIEVHNEGLAR